MGILSSADPRILVVCHGNINRSAFCQQILLDAGLSQVRGAAMKLNGGGERAAKKMRDAALEYGVDLQYHRSMPITYERLLWAELVVYMDGGNLKRLQALSPEPLPNQLWVCLGSYADPPVGRIPDPAFMRRGSAEFERVVNQIYGASANLAERIMEEKL